MSWVTCLRVQPSSALPPAGCGVVAMVSKTPGSDEPPCSALCRSGRFDRADAHPKPALDLPQQPRGELLVGRVLLLDQFQHLVVDEGQKLQELTVVHSPPPRRPAGSEQPVAQL